MVTSPARLKQAEQDECANIYWWDSINIPKEYSEWEKVTFEMLEQVQTMREKHLENINGITHRIEMT